MTHWETKHNAWYMLGKPAIITDWKMTKQHQPESQPTTGMYIISKKIKNHWDRIHLKYHITDFFVQLKTHDGIPYKNDKPLQYES